MIPYMPSCKTKLSKLNDEILVSFMEHPFMKEMALGTLSHEIFECYLVQDEMYLDLYADYLRNLSSRLSDSSDKAFIRSFAKRGVEAERALHAHLMQPIDGRQKYHPLCHELRSYDKFIRTYIDRGSVAFAFAAVLPCTWLYNLVGQSLLRISVLDGNPYREWIMAYSDGQYAADVSRFVDIALRYIESDDIDSCIEIYHRSAIYDLSLFDYAYKNTKRMKIHKVLTIAGSDSGGGAGIQADIKAISATGSYAASAVTAVTVQNTLGVHGVFPVPVDVISGQIEAVLSDIGADAVKIGMLHSSEVVMAVADAMRRFAVRNLVLDPVMVSTSGHRLIEESAVHTLKEELIPLARVITPNIPEAEILVGHSIPCQDDLPEVARELSMGGRVSVLLKAGHLTDDVLTDIFYNAETGETLSLSSERLHTRNTHGTGCTLSSAFASFLARGYSLNDAARSAKDYITEAIRRGADIDFGAGHGPVCHFSNLL